MINGDAYFVYFNKSRDIPLPSFNTNVNSSGTGPAPNTPQAARKVIGLYQK